MIYLALVLLGLSLGSFINALIWRIYEQEKLLENKTTGLSTKLKELSIVKGRSMCMACKHPLAPKDLIPVVSWVSLRGKCRYCRARINDTPFTELLLPILFIISYLVWPFAGQGWGIVEIVTFILWLGALTCLLALAVYDAKWYILPDRIVLPLTILVIAMVAVQSAHVHDPAMFVVALMSGLLISGIFFLMAYLSKGTWIGGGDIKLGLSLGVLAGTPLLAMMLIFIASILGTIAAIPSMLTGKRSMKSVLPFGPFLITAAFIIFLWGEQLYNWYFGLLI